MISSNSGNFIYAAFSHAADKSDIALSTAWLASLYFLVDARIVALIS